LCAAHRPAEALTGRVTVLAASSMARPLEAVIEAYAARSPDIVRGIYAGSGTLADQIVTNAPADIYISAHPSWMTDLRRRGLVAEASVRPLAGNRLVLLGGTKVKLPNDLRAALKQVRPRRIGIADPDHVASGRYAMQALRKLGLTDAMKDDLLVAANDPAAIGMVDQGEIPVAFGYATDALGAAAVHVVTVVPDSLHDPILYSAAIVTGHEAEAKGFFDYLTGPDALRILEQLGFLPPPAAGPTAVAAPAP
jgi:molybdate transport system substrate-binding protein